MGKQTFLVAGNSEVNPAGQDWVQGDGGPLVILQATAAALWTGASANGLMIGGDREDDYDIVSDAEDNLAHRYERDILVLDDSSQSGQVFELEAGVIAVVQYFYGDEELPDIVERALQSASERSFPFVVHDDSLRLIVGADDGNGSIYGYIHVPIVPGTKRCDLHSFDDGLVFLLSSSSPGSAGAV